MANVVWANAAGTWSTETLWSYWDDVTESVQAYGQIPQQGDTVYLNGFAVTVAGNYILNIGNGTIRNDTNPYTQIEGGYLNFATNNIIIANFYVGNTYIGFQTANNAYTMNLTGNIHLTNAVFFRKAGNNSFTLNVNGNITGTNSIATGNTGSLNVIGDVDITNGSNGSLTTGVSVTGELSITTNNWSAINASITGTLIAKNNYKLSVTNTLAINGHIYYQSSNGTLGVTYDSLVISNPNTFTWKDISETRLNPFIIVTDWDLNNEVQYPPENRVVAGTPYAFDEKVGTFTVDYPPETVVLKDYVYDNGNMTGNMSATAQVGCVTKEDVREGVPLLGMGEVGTCAVPSPGDVREGVPVDNTIGTLIVQGGGDRLRIADFGYYTNAQSDTYIVDLTEQDKPKFAVAEERVLIEMFPDLDLENIPEKYFDDLFVKYLKYRLIVEYYRTAGINSTFTPSEPTTETVNYQNVRNEVWLNSANIYLKAWAKKYPDSITKPQRILL